MIPTWAQTAQQNLTNLEYTWASEEALWIPHCTCGGVQLQGTGPAGVIGSRPQGRAPLPARSSHRPGAELRPAGTGTEGLWLKRARAGVHADRALRGAVAPPGIAICIVVVALIKEARPLRRPLAVLAVPPSNLEYGHARG